MGLYSGSELLAPLEVVHKFKPTFYKFIKFIPTSSPCQRSTSVLTAVQMFMFTQVKKSQRRGIMWILKVSSESL